MASSGSTRWVQLSARCAPTGSIFGCWPRSTSASRSWRRVDGGRGRRPMPLLSRMGPAAAGQHPHTIAVIGALAGVVAILVFLILGSGVPPPRTPGVVHTTEIKIAPEISGRLSRFAVTPGQAVHAGDELAALVNPELSASLGLAKAELGQARAQRDNVYAGVRQEEVDTLEREIETAKAD